MTTLTSQQIELKYLPFPDCSCIQEFFPTIYFAFWASTLELGFKTLVQDKFLRDREWGKDHIKDILIKHFNLYELECERNVELRVWEYYGFFKLVHKGRK